MPYVTGLEHTFQARVDEKKENYVVTYAIGYIPAKRLLFFSPPNWTLILFLSGESVHGLDKPLS